MFIHHLSKFGKFSLKIGGEIIFQSWLLLTPFFNLTIVQLRGCPPSWMLDWWAVILKSWMSEWLDLVSFRLSSLDQPNQWISDSVLSNTQWVLELVTYMLNPTNFSMIATSQWYQGIFQNWFYGITVLLQVKTQQVNLRHQEEEESPKQPWNTDFLTKRQTVWRIGVLIWQ